MTSLFIFTNLIFQTLYLSQVGGLSIKDNTNRVLSHLLSPELARQITMFGSKTKTAFKDLQLKNVLIGNEITLLCIRYCMSIPLMLKY